MAYAILDAIASASAAYGSLSPPRVPELSRACASRFGPTAKPQTAPPFFRLEVEFAVTVAVENPCSRCAQPPPRRTILANARPPSALRPMPSDGLAPAGSGHAPVSDCGTLGGLTQFATQFGFPAWIDVCKLLILKTRRDVRVVEGARLEIEARQR